MDNMDFTKATKKLPVMNFDTIVEKEKKIKHHGDLLPDSIRAVFCGPSNCGKTNSLLALITHPNGVRFENVYVYSKSLNQPKYKFLKDILEPLDGIKYFPFSEHDEVISPDEALPNSIMIFDDVACEKQDNVRKFFCMGRHKKVCCFYLCQSYAQVGKHLIRDNLNLLVLFRQDDVNLKHIYDNHVNTDMSLQNFKNLCSACWNDNHGFLVIDKDREINDGRYRKGFDNFAINIIQ